MAVEKTSSQTPTKRLTPEEVQGLILFRDGQMLIINKPAGIPVHAGPKGGINLEQYFEHLKFGLPRVPSLAHRLDRDTSGCLILGRHRKALAKLGKFFSGNKIKKTYWAIVEGNVAAESGVIDAPLTKRSTLERGWWMKVDPAGQNAVTDYKVLGRGNLDGREISWLELKPQTGRTHQLRVHCAHIGFPIVGDPVYGITAHTKQTYPMLLHAYAITIPYYPTREPIQAEAPPPHSMHESLKACGWGG